MPIASLKQAAHRSPLAKWLLAVTVLLGVGIRIAVFVPGLQRTPDERTYTHQANIVLALGREGYRYLGDELAANPDFLGGTPSPLRAGYITMLAAFMRLTHDTTELAGARLAQLCSIATLVLLAVVACRLLSPVAAVMATVLYAVSPFELTCSRRCWQECFVALLALSVLTVSVLILRTSGRGRVLFFALFSLLGLLAFGTKETSAIGFLLCDAGVAAMLYLRREQRAAWQCVAVACAVTLSSVFVLALLYGGPARVWQMEQIFLRYNSSHAYTQQWDTGPVWMFPAALFLTSPFVFLGSCMAFGVLLQQALRRTLVAGVPLGITLYTLAILGTLVATRHYNLRYTAPAFASSCLMAGFGTGEAFRWLQEVLNPLGTTAARMVLVFALAVAAMRDLQYANEHFLRTRMRDLSLREVLGVAPLPAPPDIIQPFRRIPWPRP
jgi:hypothetical protein